MSLPKWVFKEEETSGVGTGTGLGEVRETSQVRRLKRRARGTEGKPDSGALELRKGASAGGGGLGHAKCSWGTSKRKPET